MPNEKALRPHLTTLVPNGMMQVISLTAKMFSTSKNWRNYSPDKRKCYFQGEKKLQFYRSYTKTNCDYECLANHSLTMCNCVKFSLPRCKDTRVCGMLDIPCYVGAAQKFPYIDELGKNNPFPCNCYPPCNYIKYGIKSINQLPLDKKKFGGSGDE